MDRIFQLSDAQRGRIDRFLQRLGMLRAELESLQAYAASEQAAELADSLCHRTDDFFKEGRNFSIAVLGQVKAGKSSFINSLLFHGRPVLPYARTPKTAVLTRLEYARENVLTVEYLSAEEWDTLRRLAASPLDTPQVRAARETVGLVQDGGAALEQLFATGIERRPLEEGVITDKLLNDYVGENGRFTPAVKCLTLGLNLDRLRCLTVVDTPGFFDPVPSRAQRARRCLETCDAAFYLSRAGSFLDRYDRELLTELIPQRGVNHLVLVASQMDSALADALLAYPTLEAALEGCREVLRAHAEDSLGRVRLTQGPAGAAVTQYGGLVCVSALADRMAKTSPADYDAQERVILRLLSRRGDPGPQALEAIGNMEEARERFLRLASAKEEVLLRKLEALLLSAHSELTLLLERIRADAQRRIALLEGQRRESEEHHRALSGKIRLLREKTGDAFQKYAAPLDGALTSVLLGLYRLRDTWTEPALREDFVLRTQVRTVSDFRLFLPWTWGKSHSECIMEKTPRTYLDPEDVRHSLEQLTAMADAIQQAAFLQFSDFSALTEGLFAAGKLLAGDAEPEALEFAVRDALSQLAPGRVPSPASFSLPASGSSDDRTLREAAKRAVAHIFDTREREVRREAARLRDAVQKAETNFCKFLCGELWRREEGLLVRQKKLDAAIAGLRELSDLPGRYL